MTLRLIIGNKNYSSWSFRPWLAMKVANIAFEEEVISLDAADFQARMAIVSGTGKVPVLMTEMFALGFARNPGISGRNVSRCEAMAGRCTPARHARAIAARCMLASPRCAGILPMNMCRPVLRGSLTSSESQCPPHRCHLDGLSHPVRARARSSSVGSALLMPCMLRSCRASTPTISA